MAGLRPGLGRGLRFHSPVIEVVLSGAIADEAEVGSEVALCKFDIVVETEDRGRIVSAEIGSSCGSVGG